MGVFNEITAPEDYARAAFLSYKLHSSPSQITGFEWADDEALVYWWKKHDKKASRFSTDLTKRLVKTIQGTATNNIESLKTLFKEADRWLILKVNSSSSRYHQVESLRNNIFHRLTTQMGVDKSVLIANNHTLLKENNYFLRLWKHSSAAASFFKTVETKMLDKAFVAHANGLLSNEDLIEKLGIWLVIKQTSHSKRYYLVTQMRKKLQDYVRIEQIKPEQIKPEQRDLLSGLSQESDNLNGAVIVKQDLKPVAGVPSEIAAKERLAKMSKICQRALIEKKEKLLNKASLLSNFIAGKIAHLKPPCDLYENSLLRIKQLNADFYNEKSIAANATKFSHNNTQAETRFTCRCGFPYPRGYLCRTCNSHSMYPRPIGTKTTAVYIPDEHRRLEARNKCEELSLALALETEKSSHPPVEYSAYMALKEMKQKLEDLLSPISKAKAEPALLALLLRYKAILNKVGLYFSAEEQFDINEYLPRSDYAQCRVASIFSRQIGEENPFFQALPYEIQEKIALLTVSSKMPEEDAKYIFSTSMNAS